MYSNQYMLENLNRQKDKIEEMIHSYQPQQPINNFITTSQSPSRTLVEWRILNENEEVDNLYVSNPTLFISDNTMILKGVDGKLEKWEVKKIFPIDKKDKKINELEEEIKKLKEVINNEYSKSNEPTRELEQPNAINDVNAQPKPKTNGKPISRQN